MKRLLSVGLGLLTLGSAAAEADLYTRGPPTPPPVVVPAFSWTGFYIGGNIGGGWENFNVTDTLTGASFSTNTHSSFIGGGQAGFNYQVGPFVVLGVDGFFDGIASNNNNSAAVFIPGVGLVSGTVQPDWIATLAGRIGFTAPGYERWLFYAKGGGAWVQTNDTFSVPFAAVTTSRTASGWMAGAGIEWAFAPNWTVRLDYQYIGLENNALALTPGLVLPDTFTTRNANVQTLTVGVNYLFNWWGAPARYY
jgi:outer membrane immunogenic protein